jgi:hypothetical protein
VHKSGVKIVRKTSLTYLLFIISFEKIQKLDVARLNKFGFSKVPSYDTLCKSCYHIFWRTVVTGNKTFFEIIGICAIVFYLVVYHVCFQDGKLCLPVANDKLDGK